MKIMLRKGRQQQNLTPEREYYVIGIEADDYRILDDTGQPYLFAPDAFRVTDAHEPPEWHTEVGEDGERYAYPPELDAVGFFEDFFDRKIDAVKTFWQVMNQQLSKAA